jgi:transposase
MRATLFAITHDGRLARRLTMVIGVGPIVASNIVTVLDDVGRFASASDAGPYLRPRAATIPMREILDRPN